METTVPLPVQPELLLKYQNLCKILKAVGQAGVAYSGGVDSSLLLKTAVDLLGDQVLAIHAHSNLQPTGEYEEAMDLLRQIGCKSVVVEIDPFSWQIFTDNPPDRCYHCKKKIYTLFLDELRKQNIATLLDGTNWDDLAMDRPGLRAIEELHVSKPLADAKLSKEDIRQLSKELNICTWDKKTVSCLATRILAGNSITPRELERIRKCEDFLSSLGFSGCRVRVDRGRVFFELPYGASERLIQKDFKGKISRFFNEQGFDKIFLDLDERD